MTTVGYGDVVPHSWLGQATILATAIWGTFLISILIIVVSRIFDLERNQQRALHHLQLTRKAALSITSAMRFYLAKKKYKMF
mmetsp:Transcript_17377/g.12418  ORF Transcript_17377/g.12418 Transcript_17377/m.12418 type:complete len:82 (+) Transcript_17377:884-1129(+)